MNRSISSNSFFATSNPARASDQPTTAAGALAGRTIRKSTPARPMTLPSEPQEKTAKSLIDRTVEMKKIKSDPLSKPNNINRNLIGMGQVVKISEGKIGTFGCGPCIGVGVIYTHEKEGHSSVTLAHLQPEAEIGPFVNKVLKSLPDDFDADVKLIICTKINDAVTGEKQEMAIGGLQNGLAASYDYSDFSAEINLSSTGMILDADAMKAKVCSDLEVMDEVGEFTDEDLSFQISHMDTDERSLKYFDV